MEPIAFGCRWDEAVGFRSSRGGGLLIPSHLEQMDKLPFSFFKTTVFITVFFWHCVPGSQPSEDMLRALSTDHFHCFTNRLLRSYCKVFQEFPYLIFLLALSVHPKKSILFTSLCVLLEALIS